MSRRTRRRISQQRAFTLLELLVVVGVIAVIAAILLPTLAAARERARAVRCQSNVRTLMAGMLAFAADHDACLPGNWVDSATGEPDPDHRDWLMGDPSNFATGPQGGTLFKYLDGNYDVYRCPSLEAMAPGRNNAGLGYHSNGRFDYACVGVWTGVPLRSVPPTSRMYWPDGHYDEIPTPVVVQEQPNGVNGANMEGLHNAGDSLSRLHAGGSYYSAPDGSVAFVKESQGSPYGGGMSVWQARGPSGLYRSLADGGYGIKWGYWSHR